MNNTRFLRIPFKILDSVGEVKVTIDTNDVPEDLGFKELFPNNSRTDQLKTFPVCEATVLIEVRGYRSYMGWLQFISVSKGSGASETDTLDIAPQFRDTGFPYVCWGHKPTFFDAPCMLTENFERQIGINWRADAFLVRSPDGVLTKSIQPLCGFSWGYETADDGVVSISDPKSIGSEIWNRSVRRFSKEFPNWAMLNW